MHPGRTPLADRRTDDAQIRNLLDPVALSLWGESIRELYTPESELLPYRAILTRTPDSAILILSGSAQQQQHVAACQRICPGRQMRLGAAYRDTRPVHRLAPGRIPAERCTGFLFAKCHWQEGNPMKRNVLLVAVVLVSLCLIPNQASDASVEPWQPLPGPNGGSVAALALSPAYATDHTAFAGLRGPSVYRTVNGGNSWQGVSPSGWVAIDLAISPDYAADLTLFASEGLSTSGYHIQRSTDEGETWQDVTPTWTGQPDQPHLAISPDYATDQTLYVSAGSQAFVSTDTV
jgi:hypothetical protein